MNKLILGVVFGLVLAGGFGVPQKALAWATSEEAHKNCNGVYYDYETKGFYCKPKPALMSKPSNQIDVAIDTLLTNIESDKNISLALRNSLYKILDTLVLITKTSKVGVGVGPKEGPAGKAAVDDTGCDTGTGVTVPIGTIWVSSSSPYVWICKADGWERIPQSVIKTPDGVSIYTATDAGDALESVRVVLTTPGVKEVFVSVNNASAKQYNVETDSNGERYVLVNGVPDDAKLTIGSTGYRSFTVTVSPTLKGTAQRVEASTQRVSGVGAYFKNFFNSIIGRYTEPPVGPAEHKVGDILDGDIYCKDGLWHTLPGGSNCTEKYTPGSDTNY